MRWDGNEAMIEIHFGAWQTAPRPLAAGQGCFAVGDVHAHAGHLAALHAALRARIQSAYDASRVTLVWLGDYIDRGPAPGETLDSVRTGLGIAGLREVRLRGNHEQFLIDFMRLPSARQLDGWLMNGGGETVRGLLKAPVSDFAANPVRLAHALRDTLGEERVAFLDSLRFSYRDGAYFFAHAGIDPKRPLDAQSEDDLLWIREPFLSARDWPHEVVIVHGHTPGEPIMLHHRIAVDSGIYFSGRLTAVEILGDRARFISAVDPERRVWD